MDHRSLLEYSSFCLGGKIKNKFSPGYHLIESLLIDKDANECIKGSYLLRIEMKKGAISKKILIQL
jgi:hypothetical protein